MAVVSQSALSRFSFLIFSVLTIAGLFALGTWQLDRLSWKNSIITQIKATVEKPPLHLLGSLESMTIETHRRVTVTGKFLYTESLALGPRTLNGRAGWHIITPLILKNRVVIFIDRGWVNDRNFAAVQSQRKLLDKLETVTGRIKRSQRPNIFVPDNNPAKSEWYWMDTASMAEVNDLSQVAPFWIIADRETSRKVGYVDSVEMPPNNHLQYAITWFALAIALTVLTIVYWHRTRSKRKE